MPSYLEKLHVVRLLLGATGFEDAAVLQRLAELNAVDSTGHNLCEVLGLSRRPPVLPLPGVRYTQLGDLSVLIDWAPVLQGVNVLVDTDARVQVMADTASNPLPEFHRVNVQDTLHLARQATAAGVKRFVFISWVEIYRKATQLRVPFLPDAAAARQDAYGVSKKKVEQGERQIAADTGMEVVIIRPRLVYGLGVKANFAVLMRTVQRGLALVRNQRSLVAQGNLDGVNTCATHPKAANQTFWVNDGQDLSTPELIRKMADAAGVPAPLWPVPAGAQLLGKGDAVRRLCGNLRVDVSKARELLGWVQPLSVEEGMRLSFAWDGSRLRL